MKTWSRILAALVVVGMVGVAKAADEPKAEGGQKVKKADKVAKADKPGKAEKAAARANALRGEVVAVDGGTLKIKTGRKADVKEVTIATDANTKVMIEGKASALADLKPGQRVNVVLAKEDGTGPAVRIAVPAPKGQKAPKGEKAGAGEKAGGAAK